MARTDGRDDLDSGPEIGSDTVEGAMDGPELETISEGTSDGAGSPDVVVCATLESIRGGGR